MASVLVSGSPPHRLSRIRRTAWCAIAVCLALRIADAAFGFEAVEPNHPLSAQPLDLCARNQELVPCSDTPSSPQR
ncbi:MAG: hypothetical protein INF91_07800 [Alphaproteobacteria bacterium]|nr:hypothetical protein [Alphaproteobacteria bacterium]